MPAIVPPQPPAIHAQNATLLREQAARPYVLEITKSATDLGIMALKTVILLNGAAAISLLALAGQIWDDHTIAAHLVEPIRQFVMGTFAGGVASALAFASTWFTHLSLAFVVKYGPGRASKISFGLGCGLLLFSVSGAIYGFIQFGLGANASALILSSN